MMLMNSMCTDRVKIEDSQHNSGLGYSLGLQVLMCHRCGSASLRVDQWLVTHNHGAIGHQWPSGLGHSMRVLPTAPGAVALSSDWSHAVPPFLSCLCRLMSSLSSQCTQIPLLL